MPIEEIADPGDDDPSPENDPTSEPIRVQRKQRQLSVDSTDALPKAKAKVISKRPKVQLPGHVQPIQVPKKHEELLEEDDGPSHDPQASSSNDNNSIADDDAYVLHARRLCAARTTTAITAIAGN